MTRPWSALAALALVAGCADATPTSSFDPFCRAIGARSQIGNMRADWSPAPGWTAVSSPTDEAPWAVGPGTIQLTQWLPCETASERRATPAALDEFKVTFDPSTLARVTNLRVGEDRLELRAIVAEVEALEPGDGVVTAAGRFEGAPMSTSRAFHVRRLEDVMTDIPGSTAMAAAPSGSPPPATLRGGVWDVYGAASAAHEPLIVQESVPLPWARPDGFVVVQLVETTGDLVQRGAPPTQAALRFPLAGRAVVTLAGGGSASVDVVEPDQIVWGDVLDGSDVLGPAGPSVRTRSCIAGQETRLKVALRDGLGRPVSGGAVLARAFDPDKIRLHARGDDLIVDCVVPGETTVELVAGQRVSVAVTVTL